jgi:hypothetical protein
MPLETAVDLVGLYRKGVENFWVGGPRGKIFWGEAKTLTPIFSETAADIDLEFCPLGSPRNSLRWIPSRIRYFRKGPPQKIAKIWSNFWIFRISVPYRYPLDRISLNFVQSQGKDVPTTSW